MKPKPQEHKNVPVITTALVSTVDAALKGSQLVCTLTTGGVLEVLVLAVLEQNMKK